MSASRIVTLGVWIFAAFLGGLLWCLFTEEQSCHPSLLLLFYLLHNWDSEAHLGLVIGSDFSLSKIAEHPATVSECESTTMFTNRKSTSFKPSSSRVLALHGCQMRQQLIAGPFAVLPPERCVITRGFGETSACFGLASDSVASLTPFLCNPSGPSSGDWSNRKER